jgi:hypothetical protein
MTATVPNSNQTTAFASKKQSNNQTINPTLISCPIARLPDCPYDPSHRHPES